MTIDPKFIAKKIELAEKYLTEARELFELSDPDILHSSGNLHIAERLFQLIVDYVIDINKHFIKQLNLEPPDNLQNTFDILADNKILEKEFAQKIAKKVSRAKLNENIFRGVRGAAVGATLYKLVPNVLKRAFLSEVSK